RSSRDDAVAPSLEILREGLGAQAAFVVEVEIAQIGVVRGPIEIETGPPVLVDREVAFRADMAAEPVLPLLERARSRIDLLLIDKAEAAFHLDLPELEQPPVLGEGDRVLLRQEDRRERHVLVGRDRPMIGLLVHEPEVAVAAEGRREEAAAALDRRVRMG